MYRDYRIVVCVPAGRRRHLAILFRLLEQYASVVDRVDLWINTVDRADIRFAEEYKGGSIEYKLVRIPQSLVRTDVLWKSVCQFYRFACEEDTIYIKVDDDIVWLDSLEKFTDFLDVRIDNREPFLVSANVLNNAICTHLHQRFGNFPTDKGIVNWNSHDSLGLFNGPFAEVLHEAVWAELQKDPTLERFRIRPKTYELFHYERICINFIAWFGEDFAQFKGKVPEEDELWLTMQKTKELQRPVVICGDFICVHYAFSPQREHLDDRTDYLQKYAALSETVSGTQQRRVCPAVVTPIYVWSGDDDKFYLTEKEAVEGSETSRNPTRYLAYSSDKGKSVHLVSAAQETVLLTS